MEPAITIEPYTDASFKVSGELTRNFSNELKEFSGRFNPNLRGGAGWIFSNKQFDKLSAFVDQVNNGEIVPPQLSTNYRKTSPRAPLNTRPQTSPRASTSASTSTGNEVRSLIKDGMEYQTESRDDCEC